jgi:preprotein translocase subunit SecF
MSRMGSIGARLYRGEVSFDIVGNARRWYAISLVILVVSVLSLAFRGLSLGVEFRGGAEFIVPSATASVGEARSTVVKVGLPGEPIVQELGVDKVRIQTPVVDQAKANEIQDALAQKFDVARGEVQTQRIGPTWGGEISQKALTGLLVFLLLVVVYLSMAFEWKMAVAAIVALFHDLVITTGVYSLVGFEVTPATVIGLLTILGYSLYDTVVIFDKVRENTAGLAGGSRMTYSQAANLALNQTLVRSVNTSIAALLPVAGLLFIGAGLLGAGTLKDLALVLFIGMAAGTYSSIFIATPVLANLKEREPTMQALAKRVAARQAGGRRPAGARASDVAATTRAPAAPDAGEQGGVDDGAEPGEPSARRGQAEPAGARASRGGQAQRRQQPRRGGGRGGRSGGKKKKRR